VAETRRRLASAGYRSELVELAIARLIELGMLDDEAFARAWVESRDRAHPRGKLALDRELRLKGVAGDIATHVLDERESSADAADPEHSVDEQAARRLLARNRAALERVADPRLRRQRAYQLLVRKGFSTDVAARLSTGAATPEDDD
jgi:regulatory protein